MTENEAARHVLDAAFVVHSNLGPGLLESGVRVERQKPNVIQYDGLIFEEGFGADLVVETAVIAELKSVEALTRLHGKQLLTQLKLSGLKLGLLIKFGETHLKNGIKRVINGEIEPEGVSF